MKNNILAAWYYWLQKIGTLDYDILFLMWLLISFRMFLLEEPTDLAIFARTWQFYDTLQMDNYLRFK